MNAFLEAQFSLPFDVDSGKFVGPLKDGRGVEVMAFSENRALTVVIRLEVASYGEALSWCQFYAAKTVAALHPVPLAAVPQPIKITLIDSDSYSRHCLEGPDEDPWPIPA